MASDVGAVRLLVYKMVAIVIIFAVNGVFLF